MSRKNNGTAARGGTRTYAPQGDRFGPPSASRLVTTGRKVHESIPSASCALIDWFALSVCPGDGVPKANVGHWIAGVLSETFGISDFGIDTKKGGWNGYVHRLDIVSGSGTYLGLAAHGGESQRGSVYLSLDAKGCAQVSNWAAIQAWGEKQRAKIKRIDLAHDDFDGESVSVAKGMAWYHAGEFTNGGRPPAAKLWHDMDSGEGKTFYVGSRENGKLCRVYEKGRQLGDRKSNWVRAEVELHDDDRIIPWDVLTRPGDYFAGSFPCFRGFSVTPERVRTIRKAAMIEYDSMLEWVKSAAGPAIHTICMVEGGDAAATVALVARDKIPKRLRSYPVFDALTSMDVP